MRKFYRLLLIAGSIVLLQSCSKKDTEVVAYQADANSFSSKVATDWMQAFRLIVKSEGKNPPQASRVYAYAGVGLYEAVMPGMTGYVSLRTQLGLTSIPPTESLGNLDFEVSANEALYGIALQIFGTLKPENSQLIENLHTKYVSGLHAKLDGHLFDYSTDFGKKVSAATLNRAANDNFATTRNLVYTVPPASVNPANWVPTSSVLSPLEPFWGQLKCFGMPSSSACYTPSAIPFDATPGSAFYNQANEVMTTGQNLTPDQTAIAKWWADGTGTTPTPPGHWVGIATQVALQKNISLAKAAEMYAAMNMVMADAFISCWDSKYKINLLRPVSYIKTYVTGGSAWTPLLVTPPFPEYPSGHSVSSSAAADVLTRLLGTVSFSDTSNVSLGFAARSYNSFNDAANEAAISRLYGGIHYREAIQKGLLQGKDVSKAFFNNIRLRN